MLYSLALHVQGIHKQSLQYSSRRGLTYQKLKQLDYSVLQSLDIQGCRHTKTHSNLAVSYLAVSSQLPASFCLVLLILYKKTSMDSTILLYYNDVRTPPSQLVSQKHACMHSVLSNTCMQSIPRHIAINTIHFSCNSQTFIAIPQSRFDSKSIQNESRWTLHMFGSYHHG